MLGLYHHVLQIPYGIGGIDDASVTTIHSDDDITSFNVGNRLTCLDADILETVNPRGSKRAWDMDHSRS